MHCTLLNTSSGTQLFVQNTNLNYWGPHQAGQPYYLCKHQFKWVVFGFKAHRAPPNIWCMPMLHTWCGLVAQASLKVYTLKYLV